jgi:hypothetical protein
MDEKIHEDEQSSPKNRGVTLYLDGDVVEVLKTKERELDRSWSWMANLALRAFLGLPPKEGYKG